MIQVWTEFGRFAALSLWNLFFSEIPTSNLCIWVCFFHVKWLWLKSHETSFLAAIWTFVPGASFSPEVTLTPSILASETPLISRGAGISPKWRWGTKSGNRFRRSNTKRKRLKHGESFTRFWTICTRNTPARWVGLEFGLTSHYIDRWELDMQSGLSIVHWSKYNTR